MIGRMDRGAKFGSLLGRKSMIGRVKWDRGPGWSL